MKGIEIFNIKAISLKVKKTKVLGIYTRIYNATKGNNSGLTVPLIDEIVKVVQSDSDSLISALKALKVELEKEAQQKKKQAKKAA